MVTLRAKKEQFLAKYFKRYEESLYEVKKNPSLIQDVHCPTKFRQHLTQQYWAVRQPDSLSLPGSI